MSRRGNDKFGLDRDYLKFIRAYTKCEEILDYPFQWLMVEPTNHCNLKCVMCPQAGKLKRPKGYMAFSLFEKILDEAGPFFKEHAAVSFRRILVASQNSRYDSCGGFEKHIYLDQYQRYVC